MSTGINKATSKSGIQTSSEGVAYIPSSRRADGSTRKEIRVRPGYKPPEDVETYKNRSADAWKNRGSGGIPGVEALTTTNPTSDGKSKNAKRREASRKKDAETSAGNSNPVSEMDNLAIGESNVSMADWDDPSKLDSNQATADDPGVERSKKIRNHLKKLKAVRELAAKKAAGEKLSPDQLMKIGKESELLRDLKKLEYDGPEIHQPAQSRDSSEKGADELE